jgi:hypothetical protein
MIIRAVATAALLLLPLSSEAAIRHHRIGERLSCIDVRYYVARFSAPVAEMYARSRGATNAQIERARRCEPPRDCRRPFGLGYAAMAGVSSMA